MKRTPTLFPGIMQFLTLFLSLCLIIILPKLGLAQTTITTSGTWVCPAGVTSVQVECWGGGGGGASSQNSSNLYPGGGGAGGNYSKATFTVVPGNSYTVTIGAGGTGGVVSSTIAYGGNGGTTSFNGVLFASGGSGGGGGQVSNKVGLGGVNGGVRAYSITAGAGYSSAPTVTVGTAWSGNQAYTLNQQFFNAGKLYTVTTAGNSGTAAPTHTSGAVACSGGTGPFATLTYAGVQATATATMTGTAPLQTVQYISVGTSSTVTSNAGMGSGYISVPTVTLTGGTPTTAATATAITNLINLTGASTFYIGGTGGNGTYLATSITNISGGGGGSAGTASNGNNGSGTTGGGSVTGGGAGATGNSSSNATTGTNDTTATTVGGGGAGATGIGSAGVVGGAGFRGQIVITYPVMTPTGSFTAFNTIAGTPSASQSIAISGTNIAAGITITPPSGFEISTDNSTFSSSFIVGSSGTISIPNLYLRLTAAAPVGTYGGSGNNLVVTSTNAATLNIAIPTSNVTAAAVPVIVPSVVSLSQFPNTNAGSSSTSTSFSVTGSDLTANIVVTAPANFEISDDNITFSSSVTLTQSGGSASGFIYTRYSPTGNGAYSGNISLASTGATTQNVSVSGYIGTFYYKGSGGVQSTSNWSALSNGTGTSTPTDFVTDGITYNVRASGATTASWTIAGTGSKVIVGDPSVAAVSLTIGSSGAITTTSPAVIDITAASSGSNVLVVQSTSSLPTFGAVNAGSTIDFQASTTITAFPAGGFGNVTVSAGSPVYATTGMVINGNLTVSGTGTFFTENSTARTIGIVGNLSLSGTGGISNTPALTQSTTYTFTGVGKTITNTASANLFNKTNIVIGGGASYTLASDFNFITGSSNRTISGTGSLNIDAYTLNMGASALTVSSVVNNNTLGKIITGFVGVAPIPTGVNWQGTVTYNAGGQTIVGGTYRHLNLAATSSTLSSIAASATVVIVDTLTFSGSRALAASTGTLSYFNGATLFMNGTSSVTLSTNPPEWPAVNGPTYVTINTNTLLFASAANITRSLSGTLRINAAGFTINNGNTLIMNDGSLIYRNGGTLNASGGFIQYGTQSTDLVDVTINVNSSTGTELSDLGSSANPSSPGRVGTLTVSPAITYTMTGGKTITDLVNNGFITLSPTTTLTFTINGTISGTGTINGNTNASITYGGLSSTLQLTSGTQVARNLAVTNPLGTLTLAHPVALSANMVLTSGTIAAGTNNVTVAGSITGTGAFTGSGKVILTGGVASQKISGATLSNLEVNNSFIDSLTGSPTITGTLTLTSGKIAIPANDTLRVSSGNAIAGSPFSSSKYIITQADAADGKGLLEIQGFAGSKLFPVGDTLYYLPVTINAASSSNFAVGALNGATVDATPTGTALTTNAKKDIVDAKWSVRRTSGSGSATLTLGWPASLEGLNFGAFTAGQIGVSSYDGSVSLWDYSSGSGDNTTNTATRTIASLTSDDSSYAVGKVGQRLTGPASVLPGEILINQFNPGYAAGATNAYIELVNATNKTFDLSNVKIAYQDAAGNPGSAGGVLSGTLLPYSFWLLSPKSLVTVGQTNIVRDGEINGGFGANGQISLVEKNDLSDVDKLGYGTLTGGTYYEVAPASAPTAFGGLKRNTDGVDGNNNSTDFSAVTMANIDARTGSSRLAKTGVALVAGTYKDISVTGNSSLAGAVNLTGKLTVKTGATFTTNNNLTLKSTVSGTASVGQSGGTITGNVIVERYIPAFGRRAWRMLSVPTAGSQSINAAWQEGQTAMANGNPGYGTLLTNTTGANGYDAATAGNSLLSFTPGNPGGWAGVASTSSPIATTSGYMVYIRGDRSSILFGGPITQSATTLRTNGTLYQGTRPATTLAAGNNVLVGNVYASAIDFDQMTKSGITSFKVWDPKLAGTSGIGAFQTFSSLNGYDPTPGGGSYGSIANSRIESGQAFIVSSVSGGSLTLTESAKVNGSYNNRFRQVNNSSQIKVNIYSVDAISDDKLTDGASIIFDEIRSNNVDDDDAIKMMNMGENIGIKVNNFILAIEARKAVESTDTIHLSLSNFKKQQYKLELVPRNMSNNISAYIEDKFLNTRQSINLTSNSFISFNITSDAASSKSDRFSIVFKNSATAPAMVATIKAYQKEKNVQVAWTVTNEQGVKAYEVEHSTDGAGFSKTATLTAISNGLPVLSYSWIHEQPSNGDHYYRIKVVSKSGDIRYTAVAKVTIGAIKSEITVYPNPVKNKTVNLQLTNMDKGSYNVRLLNDAGQVMMTSQFIHNGGSAYQKIVLSQGIRNGSYRMEVIGDGGHRSTQNMVISND